MSWIAGAALIVVGGFCGAALRWLIARSDGEIPWGLMGVNIAAAGLASAAAEAEGWVRSLAVLGFVGALSTWSGLALAVVDRWGRGHRKIAAGALALTVLGAIGAAAIASELR